jgi:hypothetical protein
MIDIKSDETGDIDVLIGDIQYTESTEQHQRDILLAHKGHYKEVPAVGVGAINFLNDESPDDFLRIVRKEFTKDGMKVKKIAITVGGDLNINAAYTS